MINIISTALIPTVWPFTTYGGIERIAADLAHEYAKQFTIVLVGAKGSSVPRCEVIEVSNEDDMAKLRLDGITIDFSHFKKYPGPKVSVPMFSDAKGDGAVASSQVLAEHFGLEHIISPGIDISPYHVGSTEDYYLSLSRIANFKQIHYAISIASMLNVNLKIAGKEEFDRKYVESIKDEAKKHPNIEYVGEVEEKEKIELLAHSRGLIFVPNWKLIYRDGFESFGIVAIEALASGIPVFTNDIPGGQWDTIKKERGVNGLILSDNQWPDVLTFETQRETIRDRAEYWSSLKYTHRLNGYLSEMGLWPS